MTWEIVQNYAQVMVLHNNKWGDLGNNLEKITCQRGSRLELSLKAQKQNAVIEQKPKN